MSSSASLLTGTPAKISASLLPAGGGGAQTLSQSGNNVLLSGGGGSVDVSTTTTVSATAVKTTHQTVTGTNTIFGGDFVNVKSTAGLSVGLDGQNTISVGNGLISGADGSLNLAGTLAVKSIRDNASSEGTAGQVLSAGAGGALEWVAGGGGGGLPPSTVDGQYLVGEAGAFVVAGSTVHIGNGSASAGVNSVAVGVSANSDGAESVAIGHSASSIGSGVSVGHLASSQSRGVAIGENAVCTATGEAHKIAIGYNASAGGANDISIGRFSNTSAGVSIAIGNSASCSGAGGIVMGNGVISSGVGAIALGQSTRGGGDYGVTVGFGANSAGANSVSLGHSATATNVNSIVLNATGANVTSASESLYVKPVVAKTTETDVLYYDATSGLVSYGAGGGGGGGVASVDVGANGLVKTGTASDPILSLPTATATVGQYLVSDATGKFVVDGATDVKLGVGSAIIFHSVAVGSSSAGIQSVAIGYGNTSLTQSVVIGNNSHSYGNETVAVGNIVNAGELYDIAIGSTATTASNGNDSKIAIGHNTTASGASGIALGKSATADNNYGMSLGYGTSSGGSATAVGNQANAGGGNSVALGSGASSAGASSVAVGNGASSAGGNSVSLGNSATATNVNSIVLNATGASVTSASESLYVKPVVAKTTETDVLYYDATSGLVSYGAGGGGGGGVASVAVGANGLVQTGTATDPILSLPTTDTAGQYLVSDGSAYVTAGTTQVNLGGGSVASGANSVALGVSASSAGLDSIAIGNSAVSAGEGCVSYGYGAQTNLLHDIAIGSGAVCPPNFGPPPIPQAGINRIAIGNGAVAYGENCISIGHTISNAVPNSIVIGNAVNSVFLESLYVKPIAQNQDSTNILYYNESNGLVTYGAGGGGGGGVTSITAGSNIAVDSTIPSAPVVAVSISSALDMNGQNITEAVDVGGDVLSLTGATSLALDAPTLTMPSLASASASSLLNYDADTKAVSYAPNFRPTNMWYVAMNGSDTNDGSYSSPYLTVQKAIDIVEAQSTSALIGIVNIAPGHYTEDLTFTNGYIILMGVNGNTQDTNEVTEITGNVTINLITGVDDKFNKQIVLSDLQFTESPDNVLPLINDISTKQHTLFLQNCYLFAKGTVLRQNSSAECVVRMTEVEVNQDGAGGTVGATLHFSIGQVYMERVDVDTNQDTNSMLIDGTATLSRCALCSFEQSFASTAGAIVNITSTSVSPHTFGNCSFVCMAGTVYGIRSTLVGALGTGINLVQCSFLVTGVATKAINNAGYVYYYGNGAFPGLASGYTGVLIAPYTPM